MASVKWASENLSKFLTSLKIFSQNPELCWIPAPSSEHMYIWSSSINTQLFHIALNFLFPMLIVNRVTIGCTIGRSSGIAYSKCLFQLHSPLLDLKKLIKGKFLNLNSEQLKNKNKNNNMEITEFDIKCVITRFCKLWTLIWINMTLVLQI